MCPVVSSKLSARHRASGLGLGARLTTTRLCSRTSSFITNAAAYICPIHAPIFISCLERHFPSTTYHNNSTRPKQRKPGMASWRHRSRESNYRRIASRNTDSLSYKFRKDRAAPPSLLSQPTTLTPQYLRSPGRRRRLRQNAESRRTPTERLHH